jgi:hypothetical protein
MRTSRERIKKTSTTTSEGFSAAVNSSTDMITSDRRISLATEGLPLYVDKRAGSSSRLERRRVGAVVKQWYTLTILIM